MKDLKALMYAVCEVAREAGKFILANRSDEMIVEEKSRRDYVTAIDKGSEVLIVKALKMLLPEAGFITEEGSVEQMKLDANNVSLWIVDPLDGTTNFIHGFPVFSVSIALMVDRELVLGVVYEVNSGECFSAYKGGGAWLNGKAIGVSRVSEWGRAILITGFVHNRNVKMSVDRIFSLFQTVCLSTSGVRRLGSAATNLAYIAAGRADGFYESGLSPWDVAAGVVLINEAGGCVTDFDGERAFVEKYEIIATNGLVHEHLRELIVNN